MRLRNAIQRPTTRDRGLGSQGELAAASRSGQGKYDHPRPELHVGLAPDATTSAQTWPRNETSVCVSEQYTRTKDTHKNKRKYKVARSATCVLRHKECNADRDTWDKRHPLDS